MSHVVCRMNWWKSFVLPGVAIPMDHRRCMSLFGSKSETHRIFAEQVCAEHVAAKHVAAECFARTEGCGLTVDELKMRPEELHDH